MTNTPGKVTATELAEKLRDLAYDQRFIGTNDVANPQASCPRAGLPTGVGYELCSSICGQYGHAEAMACLAAGARARGGILYLEGHYYACEPCKRVCDEHGTSEIRFEVPPA